MYILGIDPGLQGGLCILNSHGIIDLIKMPLTTRDKRKGNYIDIAEIYLFINKYMDRIQHISIERQFILRSQGMSSGSKTMYQSGILYGLCWSLCSSIEEVNAKDWQSIIFSKIDNTKIKTYNNYNTTKLNAIAYVEQTYGIDYLFKSTRQTKPSDGLADAICIAAASLDKQLKQLNK